MSPLSYVPQEEVPLYESKGKLFAQRRPTGPVAGVATPSTTLAAAANKPAVTSNHGPGLVIIKPSRPAKQKQAPAEKKTAVGSKAKSAAAAQHTNELASQIERLSLTPEEEKDPDKLLKHLKKLRKKLREIDNIEQKIGSGEIKTPDKDQLDKVGRKELIRVEVERLEQHPLLPQAEAMQQLRQQEKLESSAVSPT